MPLQLRPVTEADYPRLVEIINAQSREPVTVEDLRRQDQQRPKGDPFLRLGAVTADGALAGFGVAQGGSGYRPGAFFVRIRVDAPYRQQGIGQALYAEMVAFARAHGATRLESMVMEDDPESLAWAERRGFVKEHHLFESTLSLSDFDPTPFREVVEQVKASGIRFTTLADEVRDGDRIAALHRLWRFNTQLFRDIPGQGDLPDYPWEAYLQYVENHPRWRDDMVLLAADGDRWVGICHLMPLRSGGLYNDFTGVDREYRGRHIALALKVWSLEVARSLGAPYVRTNNHSANQPMLAINRKLGYVPQPGLYELAARLQQG